MTLSNVEWLGEINAGTIEWWRWSCPGDWEKTHLLLWWLGISPLADGTISADFLYEVA